MLQSLVPLRICVRYVLILCALGGNVRDLDYFNAVVNCTFSCSIFAVTTVSPVRVHEQVRPASQPTHTGRLASGSPPARFTPTPLMRPSAVWGGTSESLNFVKDGGVVSNLTPDAILLWVLIKVRQEYDMCVCVFIK